MVKKIYFVCMYAVFLLAYINEIFKLPDIIYKNIALALVLVFLICSLSLARGFQLYISLASLVLGNLVFWYFKMDFAFWRESLLKTISMLVLFTVIPMISFPIKHGGYLESIEGFAYSNRKRPGLILVFLSTLLLSLAIALNIGCIPTMYKLLEKINLPKKYLARIMTSGYCAYIVFSPYDALILMFLLLSGTNYAEYFIFAVGMVITIISINYCIIRFDIKLMDRLKIHLAELNSGKANLKIYELLVHILVLIGLAFLVNKLNLFSIPAYSIALVIIAYSFLWCLIMGVFPKFKTELQDYSKNLLAYKSFLPFFISMSFFGAIIAATPLKDQITGLLIHLNTLPLFVIIELFMLITVIFSLCGIHMMITVTALVFTVNPQIIGLSSPAFALTLLSSWVAAMSITPFAPFAAIVADTINEKITNVTFKYNWPFTTAFCLVAPLVIILLNGF